MQPSSGIFLPFEIVEQIISALEQDPKTLATCCLLDREVNNTASTILYKTLDLEIGRHMGPGRRSYAIVNRLDAEKALTSACLPRNRHRVKRIILRGTFVDPNLQSDTFINAFQHVFHNIDSITFNVTDFFWDNEPEISAGSAVEALRLYQLRDLAENLRELTLNSIAWGLAESNGIKPELLLNSQLRKVALIELHGGRFDWVEHVGRCSELRELQIRSFSLYPSRNYQVLDATIERSLKRLQKLRSLTLGCLFIPSDDHTFGILSQLPHLEELSLEYDFAARWFSNLVRNFSALPIVFPDYPLFKPSWKLATTFTPLQTLKSFTLRYREVNENFQVPSPQDLRHLQMDQTRYISLPTRTVELLSLLPAPNA
ncbi:hypothetical protein VNI00_003821 [Paramarasmius palmivorus]|uniref:F-box domain-containing protein n=1 Tax=Paramarasmius palmivorus TaxID=297713 RepID=A0AAW0DKI6_9AGAR